MPDDAELLRKYSEAGSEEAFAIFARNRLNLVYSAALRRVGGDTHLAQEVTQEVTQKVFCMAARRSAVVARHPYPAAWLYETTRFTALSFIRAETRRRQRERILSEEAILNNEGQPLWDRLAPLLDGAIDRLGDGDRTAILLRFFEGLTFPEIAARLHLTDSGARLRVDRALTKLHRSLCHKGITSTAVGLAVALESHAIGQSPAEVAAALSKSALTVALSDSTGGSISKIFLTMNTTKVSLTAVAILAIGSLLYEAIRAHRAETALGTLTKQSHAVEQALRA